MRVIGIMSGSSLDGLDIVLIDFQQGGWKTIKYEEVAFDDNLLQQLRRATEMSVKELAILDFNFCTFCAQSIQAFIKDLPLPDLVGSHGHTIFHAPDMGYSIQIGNGGTLAALTNIPTVSDFRMTDVALGGQGAPLAPIVERELFTGYEYYLNLGGIANISVHRETIVSYDICPCNQVLNHFAQSIGQSYDINGSIAAKGTINNELLLKLLALPYFHHPSPKSLDNSWVKNEFIPIANLMSIPIEDRLATMVEFIAEQVTLELQKYASPSTTKMLVTGGGAHNSYLIDRMRFHLRSYLCEIVIPERIIVDSKEAVLMALMAYYRFEQKENTIKEVTGASRASISGALYLP